LRITPRVAGAVVALIPVLLLPSPALSSPGGGVEAPDAPGAQSAHDDGSAERAPAPSPSPSPRLGSGHRFPIRGPHNLGYGASNNFGGSRGHQGQDLFAACGTPVVAARGGEVRAAGYQSAAGNYAVVTGETTGIDYVYMHMLKAPRVREGDQVRTGEALGAVGETGRATGCHLHFEMWSAPGWQSGGSPFDPLPHLRAWGGRSSLGED